MLDGTMLVRSAQEQTELDDFGDDSWRDGYDRLIHSLNTEAELTPAGEAMLGMRISMLLMNRLRIEQQYKDNPEIADERVEGPVFVVGLPRTGTTALSQLIAADPQVRSLRLWESSIPVPPPEKATEHTDPRIAMTQGGIDQMLAAFPRWGSLYHQEADTATECQDLLGMDFRAEHFTGMAYIPSYIRWVVGCDMTSAYAFHHRVLKLLQWRCGPKLWHLKTPVHMQYLDYLVKEYPGAKFLWSHRDPAKVMASLCSLIAYCRTWASDRDDTAIVGEEELEIWVEAMRRATDFRDRMGDDRFADVPFADLQTDPVGAIERGYAKLALDFGAESRAAVTAWAEGHPPGGHGTHKSSLDEFGLTPEHVHERFDEYMKRFATVIS